MKVETISQAVSVFILTRESMGTESLLPLLDARGTDHDHAGGALRLSRLILIYTPHTDEVINLWIPQFELLPST